MAESPSTADRLAKKVARRLMMAIVVLLIGIAVSSWRLAQGSGDAEAYEAVQALQDACLQAGYSSDADGVCYVGNPALMTEAERQAATVPPPPPGGAASSADPAAPAAPADAPGAPAAAGDPSDAPAAPAAPADPNDPTSTVAGAAPAAPGSSTNSTVSTNPLGGGTVTAIPATPGGGPSEDFTPLSPAAPAQPVAPGSDPTPPAAAGAEPDENAPNPVTVRESIRLTLPLNFDPDPFGVVLDVTGGAVDVGAAGSCEGWAGSDPDIVLTYTDAAGTVAGSSGLPLRVFFESIPGGEDTSLIINDPYGNWWCNADGLDGAVDPVLTFLDAGYGIYDIWIGATVRGDGPRGAVYITERPLNPAN